VVGRERVIAGADCGFGTFAGMMTIHPTVAWAKLDALVKARGWRARNCGAPAPKRRDTVSGRLAHSSFRVVANGSGLRPAR
jgi:hypothetical protein